LSNHFATFAEIIPAITATITATVKPTMMVVGFKFDWPRAEAAAPSMLETVPLPPRIADTAVGGCGIVKVKVYAGRVYVEYFPG
jgi:hypothetical protein